MTKKQMQEEIKTLEEQKQYYFDKWDCALQSFRNAVEENKTIKKSLKEAQATAEEWKCRYLEMLDINIRLAEKIKNREETQND